MRNQNGNKNELIYPSDNDQVIFWTKKWGISAKQLNDAILETGSVNVKEIKHYLCRKGILFSMYQIQNYIKIQFFNYTN